MERSIIAILFFTFLTVAIQAQDTNKTFKNQLDVDIGYQKIYLKDDNFSPLNQNGGGLIYSISYNRGLNNRFGVSIQYSSGNLDSGPLNRFNTSYINANLRVEYLAGLSLENRSFDFYFGGTYNTRVLFLDWYDLDAFSFTTTHGISLKGLLIKEIGKKHFAQSALTIPVLQFLSRPPYNGIDEFIIENQDNPAIILFNSNLESMNKYLGLEWLLSYTYQFSSRLDLRVEYTLYFQKVDQLNHFKSLSNAISTGITINF